MVTNRRRLNNQDESDLQFFVQMVKSNYRLLTLCVLLSLVMAFVISKMMPTKYKISSSLLITEKSNRNDNDRNEYLSSNLFTSEQNLQNELWMLKSITTLNQTISNLNLAVEYQEKNGLFKKDIYGESPFLVELLPDHVQPVNVNFNVSFNKDNSIVLSSQGRNISVADIKTGEIQFKRERWNFKVNTHFGNRIIFKELGFILRQNVDFKPDAHKKYGFVIKDYISLTNKLSKNLEFNIVDQMATVIEINCTSNSVIKGNDILNEIMRVYSKQDLDRKNHLAKITIDYIEQQLNEISDSLNINEEDLQRFRSSNYLLNAGLQAQNFSTQYQDLQNQLAEIKTRKRYYDYVADYLLNNDDFSSMTVPASMGMSDNLLNNLMSDLITAQTERSNLVGNDQGFNPMVKKLTVKIENLKGTILNNITSVQQTVEISIDELEKRIAQLRSNIRRMPETQQELGGLERKYQLNDAIYNYLLEKRAEAKITLASNIPNCVIISPARTIGPRPVSPNYMLNYMIALMLGIILPLIFILIRKVINNKIDVNFDMSSITDVAVYGKIMHKKLSPQNGLFEVPEMAVQESFRALRTNIEYQFVNQSCKVIMITSCIEKEGKSFVASNLAYSYAQLGFKTLLINFDLRKKYKYFTEDENYLNGIYSWHAENLECDDIIKHSEYENLDFIQSGQHSSDPAKILTHHKIKVLINQLKERYNCIVLDTSPLAQVSDAFLLMEYADIKLVVARYNHSVKSVISLIMNDLRHKKIKDIGIVMNDNDNGNNQYGYGYGYTGKNGNGQHEHSYKIENEHSELADKGMHHLQ